MEKLKEKNRLLTMQIIALSAKHLDACDEIGDSNELTKGIRRRVCDNAKIVSGSIGITYLEAMGLILDYQHYGVTVQEGCENIN